MRNWEAIEAGLADCGTLVMFVSERLCSYSPLGSSSLCSKELLRGRLRVGGERGTWPRRECTTRGWGELVRVTDVDLEDWLRYAYISNRCESYIVEW